MDTQTMGECLACGTETKNRCSSCAKAGIDLFFCSPEHQKMVWQGHKLFCGPNAFPFSFPLLSETEASDIIATLDTQAKEVAPHISSEFTFWEYLTGRLKRDDLDKMDVIKLLNSCTVDVQGLTHAERLVLLASDTLPVYEDITLEWNPGCVTIDSSTVDLYLSVEEDSGWLAVHEWTNVQYAQGKLDTQLKPGWWNASTGAGQVSAQLSLVPSGQPRWNTPAPAGPVFAIAYNGSYPSVTQSAASSNYTGPSVESVADPATKSSSPSGGKLGAAIAVPLLVVALAVAGYVTWHKLRKRPEKKRFSAVVDYRMSMISQGTWQPRPSMAGSRPGSFHPSHRPSGSQYTAANRQSYFADPNARHSTYSFAGSGVGVPSPLGAGIRQPPPAEMRQTGSGERMSRVSFAAGEALGRPSFASQARPGSVHTRSSLHQSQLRNSTFFSGATEVPLPPSPGHSPQLSRSAGPTFGSSPSVPRSPSSSTSLAVTAPEGDYFSRSGTREELASIRSPSNSSSLGALAGFSKPVKPFGHAHKTSVASSLRNELSSMPAAAIVRDGRLAYSQPPSASGQSSPVSPFGEHALSAGLPSPALSSPSLTDSSSPNLDISDSSMPRAFHDSHRSSQILSPDEALASYARDATSPTPGQARGAAKGGLGGFLGGWRRAGMMRSLTGGSIASVLRGGAGRRGATEVVREEEEDAQEKQERERAKSPFEDPEEVDEKQEEGVHAGLELELGESVGYAEGFERREREKRDEVMDEKSGHAL